jgi:hypothetical protein
MPYPLKAIGKTVIISTKLVYDKFINVACHDMTYKSKPTILLDVFFNLSVRVILALGPELYRELFNI